ncbi:MAG: hypothetical protein QM702_03330 [Rubrivivax sp.]
MKIATSIATTQIERLAVFFTGVFRTPVRLAIASTPLSASTIATKCSQTRCAGSRGGSSDRPTCSGERSSRAERDDQRHRHHADGGDDREAARCASGPSG